MRFLILADIEGVSCITSYAQAERSELGRRMLLNDLNACIDGIRDAGHHEIVVYDMHTDGRNIDPELLREGVSVVMGKPIDGARYKGLGGEFDGLFLVGLHAMANAPIALLAHSYLREYDAIHVDGRLVGEIGVEAYLAGEWGIPLRFVAGDDFGCAEAQALTPGVVTASVKRSLGADAALCLPLIETRALIREAAKHAVLADPPQALRPKSPTQIQVTFSDCAYHRTMRALHPALFEVGNGRVASVSGDSMLEVWARYLTMEKEMVAQ